MDLAADRGFHGRHADVREHTVDERGDLRHLGFLHPACRHGGRAETDAARDHGTARLERDGVLVHRDPRAVERLLGVLPRDIAAGEVHQQEMRLGTARDEPEAAGEQRGGERLRVPQDLLLIGTPFRRERLAEGDGLARNHVHQRPALDAGHDGLVERLRVRGSAHHHAAARTAQRLVRGGRHPVRDPHR